MQYIRKKERENPEGQQVNRSRFIFDTYLICVSKQLHMYYKVLPAERIAAVVKLFCSVVNRLKMRAVLQMLRKEAILGSLADGTRLHMFQQNLIARKPITSIVGVSCIFASVKIAKATQAQVKNFSEKNFLLLL